MRDTSINRDATRCSYMPSILSGFRFVLIMVCRSFMFRSLMTSQEFGMSAAVGLYQSVLCFILIMITNRTVKKIDPDSALF